MAINESQKVDWLWKKLGYGVAKTDVNGVKAATNESIASPLLIRGDNIWQDSAAIPGTKPTSSSTIVEIYDDSGNGSATIETTADATATPNRTWKTNSTDWISAEFGSTYLIKVYLDNAGAAAPQTTGTQLFAAGSGNNDEWYFDFQSGVLNFIGDNLPSGINGKKIYVVGARYIGNKGTNLSSANIANFTFNNNTIGVSNANGDIILDPDGTGKLSVLADNVTITGNGALTLPVGTTAQRSTPNAQGMIRYNTTDSTFEGYDGANWGSLGGVKDVDGDTYIVAETGAGTDNDQLDFYTAGAQRFQIGATGDFKFGDTLTEVTIAGATGDTVIGGTLDAGNSTLSSAIVSDLTDNRIVIAGTAGLLEDDVNFTFDGTELAVGVTNFTVAQATGNVYTAGNLVVTGDFTVNGTQTTVNSNTVTIDDPIFTLGGDTAPATDDNKDRGIEFNYFDTTAKVGFFGFDDNTGHFTFIPDATNTSEVFSGTTGELDAKMRWANLLDVPSTALNDTTYNISAETNAGGTNLRLTDSNAVEDDVLFANGTNITIARTDDSTITISSIDTITNAFNEFTVTDTDTGFTWTETGTALADATTGELTFVSGTDINVDVDATSDAIRFTNTSTLDSVTGRGSVTTNGISVNTLTSTVATGDAPLVVASTTLVTNLNADLLDGQEGTYYLDWTNTTNKPDPVITLGGDLSGNVTLTDLTSGTLNATINANSVELGTDTTGNYVSSLVAGTGVTLTNNTGETATPTIAIGQEVETTSDVTFNSITGPLTGNADTASKWANPRTVTFATGDVTGSFSIDGSTDVSNVALTIGANSVALGTDTTGNYVATIAGTANEIEVTGSGTETSAVTIGLPDDVTIGQDLIVTGALDAGETTLASATVSDLTATRVVIAGTAGAIEDSANLTFNGSILAVTAAATISTTLGVTGIASLDGGIEVRNTANNGEAFTVAVGTGNTVIAGTVAANSTGDSLTVADTLRIAQTGSGLRMTNVGGFDNDGSDNFRVFGTNDLILAANGDSGTAITIDAANQNVEITNDLVVTGDLTVSGTTTYINTTTLNIGDNIITLNADIPNLTAPTENAGIEVLRGTGIKKSFIWDETADNWTAGTDTIIAGTFEGSIDGGTF